MLNQQLQLTKDKCKLLLKVKPAITDFFGHLEATETRCEHKIDVSSPFK